MNHSIESWVYNNFDNVRPVGNELNVCCPFCVNDVKYHMYISTAKPFAHCHKCGWSGTYMRLIQEVLGTESYAEAYRQLTQPTPGINQLDTVVNQMRERKAQAPKLTDMPDWFQPFRDANNMPYHAGIVLRYALKRLSAEDIIHYNIGFCKDMNNQMALRLIIPVERGYYQARAINNLPAQKYLNPVSSIEDRLFNPSALENFDEVYIAEGAISAIATGRNAIATLGANGATTLQRKRLALSRVRHFIIIVEPEKVARDKAIVMADFLQNGQGKRVTMRVYDDGDPASSDIYKEQPYGMAFLLSALRL